MLSARANLSSPSSSAEMLLLPRKGGVHFVGTRMSLKLLISAQIKYQQWLCDWAHEQFGRNTKLKTLALNHIHSISSKGGKPALIICNHLVGWLCMGKTWTTSSIGFGWAKETVTEVVNILTAALDRNTSLKSLDLNRNCGGILLLGHSFCEILYDASSIEHSYISWGYWWYWACR